MSNSWNSPERLQTLKVATTILMRQGYVSAAPQQSEICVKFSVFHTVFDVKSWWNFPSHTQTLENVARKISPKFHAKFHDTFGREKRRKISLPHFCRVAALRLCALPRDYRSSQIDYRERFFLGGINFRLQIQNRAARRIISITETDLWEFQQKISCYRYRLSLKFQLIFHCRYRFRAQNELIL